MMKAERLRQLCSGVVTAIRHFVGRLSTEREIEQAVSSNVDQEA